MNYLNSEINELRKRVELYRKALEFYADERNYDEETGAVVVGHVTPGTVHYPTQYDTEPEWGERARAALTAAAGEEE